MTKTSTLYCVALGAAAAAALVSGCAPPPPLDATVGVQPIKVGEIKFDAEAGLEPTIVGGDDANMVTVAKRYDFGRRGDPFHMLLPECDFDSSQLAERLIGEAGYVGYFEIPDAATGAGPAIIVEPLPLWRLSGVILSDGVCALLDTGDRTIPIRPGVQVEGTDWTVVSISADKAVLRRRGKSPSEFVVPLQGRMNPAAGGVVPRGGGNQGGQAGDQGGQAGEQGARAGGGMSKGDDD